MQFPFQTGKPETPAERNARIATEQGAVHAKAVVEILKPFDEQTAAGPMPFAMVGGQIMPLESAVTRLRDRLPTLPRCSTPTASSTTGSCRTRSTLAIRTHSPALVHLGPIGKRW